MRQEIVASPLAQRIAAAKGLSLAGIRGSGRDGRILKSDIVPPLPSISARTVEGTVLPARATTLLSSDMSATRAPAYFYLTAKCRLDPLLALRDELNATLAPRGITLSVSDMLVKAMAMAMAAVPEANVRLDGDTACPCDTIDIGVTTPVDERIVTPVLRNAASLSLSAIATRSRLPTDEHLTTGTGDGTAAAAAISDLGAFGVDETFPALAAPQVLNLGIGAPLEQPWKIDGQVGLATILTATGGFDPRAISSATAAKFMERFRETAETPILLLS